MPTTKVQEIPESLAQCADLLYEIRKARLSIQKDVDALKEREVVLTKHILARLPQNDATGIAGKVARVSLVTRPEPVMEDKELLHEYIKLSGAWDLLQGRLSGPAIRERWADGKQVPGIGVFNVDSLSVSKV